MSHAQGSTGESATLARDLADFLIELSIALHKNSIYPLGHPLLDSAVRGVERRLTVLLESRDAISLGVARDQLVIEGVATDPENPLLRELAGRLHRHQLGAVRFNREATPEELRDFLATVAVEPLRTDKPLGLEPADVLNRWAHVRLFPMTFDQLELVDDGQERATDIHDAGHAKAPGADQGRSRGVQLWVGLARAAVATGLDLDAEDAPPPPSDPVAVAKAIDEHGKDVAYDQVVVGYLLQIAAELKNVEGRHEALALKRRISRLVQSLQPDTLRRLMDMGGDAIQRKRFALDTTQGLAVDAVVDIVQAAADTSQQNVSHSMMRLLSKFAVHAEQGSKPARGEFEGALREHVHKLISDWNLADPNPDAYRQALDQMSHAAPLFTTSDQVFPPEPERMIQMALEVGTVGEALWRAVDAWADRENFLGLLDLLDRAPASEIRRMIWERIATGHRLRRLLEKPAAHPAQLERLVTHMGFAAAQPLIDAIERAEEGDARILGDLVASLGGDVAPVLAAHIATAPRPLQRALLALLARLPETEVNARMLEYVRHVDPDLRREALRVVMKAPSVRAQAVSLALNDTDPRTIFTALNAALGNCPVDAVPAILRKVADPGFTPELRTLGIRVLASIPTEDMLHWLVQRALVKRRFLFGRRLAPKSVELLAVLTGLATYWRDRAEAAQVLGLARAHSDPDIKAAASGRATEAGIRTPRNTVEFMTAVQVREAEEAAARVEAGAGVAEGDA